jgi:hypothetical protein
VKKTVVIGASPNPERYAYRATMELQRHGHEVIPVGLREGKIGKVEIRTDRPHIDCVDTVSLYVGPRHQDSWIDYIVALKPKRVIFNPGTEYADTVNRLEEEGIKWEESCTLVLLTIGAY